ncbi:MAG: type restriction enzyme, partial [Trebonia sp.]|nr:type restriction enzyme [Trebonia sp.]
MKLQFKVQRYQTDAVDAVVDICAGQPKHDGVSYRVDPGRQMRPSTPVLFETTAAPDSG